MPSKLQKNGQVTVPKGVRDYLGLCPGTEVVFGPAADGAVVIERAVAQDRQADLPSS
jgi:antitoxin PrlF